jgi:hypothetical protein
MPIAFLIVNTCQHKAKAETAKDRAERNPNSEALIGAEVKEKDATEDVKQDL